MVTKFQYTVHIYSSGSELENTISLNITVFCCSFVL